MSECDTNLNLNVNFNEFKKKKKNLVAKNSTDFFCVEVTVCFAKVKINRFNPACVVPEEHLESLEEHFHRCCGFIANVYSLVKGASAVEPGPKTPRCHKL